MPKTSIKNKSEINKMKKSILKLFAIIIMIIFSATDTSAQIIGKVIDNKAKITVNQTELIAGYTDNLNNNSQLNASFSSVELVGAGEQYFLVFRGNNLRSTLLVTTQQMKDGSVMLMAQGGTSCTTTDCSHESTGCVPNWLSKSCDPCNNKGKCTRTTSNRSMIPELQY